MIFDNAKRTWHQWIVADKVSSSAAGSSSEDGGDGVCLASASGGEADDYSTPQDPGDYGYGDILALFGSLHTWILVGVRLVGVFISVVMRTTVGASENYGIRRAVPRPDRPTSALHRLPCSRSQSEVFHAPQNSKKKVSSLSAKPVGLSPV